MNGPLINGMRVVTSELVTEPKIQLSNAVTVSEKFRFDTNTWLTEMFGRRPGVYISQGLLGQTIFAHPAIADDLKNNLKLYDMS
jgi:hypothetical protein